MRWSVAGQSQHKVFPTFALADSFRSKLISHQRKGSAFHIATGLPEPMMRQTASATWYDHMCRYIDAKWAGITPKSRKSIADALATATPALIVAKRGQPSPSELREVVYSWVCVAPARSGQARPRHDLADAVRWLEQNTVTISDLQDRTRGPELARAALDTLAIKLDGTRAAPNTIARKRAALYNAFDFAVETGQLSANPIDNVRWKMPKKAEALDPQAVVSLKQGQRLLTEVHSQGVMGARLMPFFARFMYAGLRLAEAIALRLSNIVSLPETGWGEFRLHRSTPRSGLTSSDTGRSREDRSLKHRSIADTRLVPIHPALCAILRHHITACAVAPGARLFAGPLGGMPAESQYLAIWSNARRAALTPEEFASALAKRPYDLRHFALSYWLNSGVPATQVAAWAGNSVNVLLKTYAKCIVGQDKAARHLVEEATNAEAETEPDQYLAWSASTHCLL